ncbi:MAG: hypothetical protein EBU90_18475 [Proteobacteria bacterium]|nr:hypothetical protein [Pseudomonadota bacterium]NBP15905.1 hypothetical protein [bacterium]
MKILRVYVVLLISYAFLGLAQNIYAPEELTVRNAQNEFDAAQKQLEEAQKSVAQKELEAQRAQEARDKLVKDEQLLEAEKAQGKDVTTELQQIKTQEQAQQVEAERAQQDLQQAEQLEIKQEQVLKDAQAKLATAEQQVAQANQSQAEKIKTAEEINNMQNMVENLIVAEGNKQGNRSLETSVADYQDLIGKRKALEVMLNQYKVGSPEYTALKPTFDQLKGVELVAHTTVVEKLIDIMTKNPDLVKATQQLARIKAQLDLVHDDLDASLTQFTKTVVDLQAKIADIMNNKIPKEQAASQLKVIVNKQLLLTAAQLSDSYATFKDVEKLGTLVGSAQVKIIDRVMTMQQATLGQSFSTRERVDRSFDQINELINLGRASQAAKELETSMNQIVERLSELKILEDAFKNATDANPEQLKKFQDEIALLQDQRVNLDLIRQQVSINAKVTEVATFEAPQTFLRRVLDSITRTLNGLMRSLGLSKPKNVLNPEEQVTLLNQSITNINQKLVPQQVAKISEVASIGTQKVVALEAALETLSSQQSITQEQFDTLELLISQTRQSISPVVLQVAEIKKYSSQVFETTFAVNDIESNATILDIVTAKFNFAAQGQPVTPDIIKKSLGIDLVTGKALDLEGVDPFGVGYDMYKRDKPFYRDLGRQELEKTMNINDPESVYKVSDMIEQEQAGIRILQKVEEYAQAKNTNTVDQFFRDNQSVEQSMMEDLYQSMTRLGSNTLQTLKTQSFETWTSETLAELGSIREGIGRASSTASADYIKAMRDFSSYYGNMPIIRQLMITGQVNNPFVEFKDSLRDSTIGLVDTRARLDGLFNQGDDKVQDLISRVDVMQQKLHSIKIANDDPLNDLLP